MDSPSQSENRRAVAIRLLVGIALVVTAGFCTSTTSFAAAPASTGFSTPVGINYSPGGLSCTGPGDCTVVGTTGQYGEPMYETETNGNWSPETVIPVTQPEGDGSSLDFVSCTDSLDCTALGSDPSGQIAITESDGSWGPLAVIVPAGEGDFSGLSCTGAGDCTAVGGPDDNGLPIMILQSDGTWGSPVEVQPPLITEITTSYGSVVSVVNTSAYFSAISCAATGCTAVGVANYYGPEGTGPGYEGQAVVSANIYATEVDGAWSSIAFSPIPTSAGTVTSISCTGAGDCTAIVSGSSSVTESDGVWGPITPFAVDGYTINSVSCSDALDCTAVAEYNYEPAYAIETDGTWGPLTVDFVPIDAGMGIVAGFGYVSCSDAADCTAVGVDGPNARDAMMATTFDPGGAITVAKSSGLVGHYVETVSGTGWAAKGDTSVTLNECATTYDTASSCDTIGSVAVTKKGKFSNALVTLAVGSIDTNDDTCGLAGSNPCYLVVAGSSGDWTSGGALSFKSPKAALTKATAVAKNYVDDVKATDFPIGDTVTAQECDSSVNPATNLATNCDTATMISGTVGASGTVTFSPAGVKVKVGSGYVETGTGTVVKGGTADIVVNDSTTSGVSVVIPIALAS